METVLSAISFGLFAGLSPGPLMALVLSASLERGSRAGALTAIAPLLTDIPVILLSLLVLGQVPGWFLASITIAGGLFVTYLGVRTVVDARKPLDLDSLDRPASQDMWRGAVVNLLGPHPWLFWFTVGTPIMLERWPLAPWESIAFPTVFSIDGDRRVTYIAKGFGPLLKSRVVAAAELSAGLNRWKIRWSESLRYGGD